MTYALVQHNLRQTIDRADLEEASVVAPSVARGDCVRLARSLFGIVVQDLGEDEARALQKALQQRNFPTDVVPQHELPLLPHPVRKRGLRLEADTLVALDGIGREETITLSEIRFAAGGFLTNEQYRQVEKTEWDYRFGPTYGMSRNVVTRAMSDELHRETQFRLELFLSRAPYRWQFPVDSESFLRVNGDLLRLRDRDRLAGLLHHFGELLAGQVNLGIAAQMNGETLVYPSPGAFDEELIWHLYQSLRGNQPKPA